jgi:hypothetical protein
MINRALLRSHRHQRILDMDAVRLVLYGDASASEILTKLTDVIRNIAIPQMSLFHLFMVLLLK